MTLRDKTIDIAKGLGIIAIVWGHTGPACYCKDELYLFHIPLFFILSGYFYKDNNLTFFEILSKRIKSYIIPYFLFSIIALSIFAVMYLALGYNDKIYISPGIIIHPYGVVGPLWFLISLFEVHIGYYLINRYVGKEWLKLAVCIFFLLLGNAAYRLNINIPLYICSSFSMIFFFYIGAQFHKLRLLESARYRIMLLIFSIVFYSIGIMTNASIDIKTNKIDGNLLLAVFAAIGGSYLVIYVSYLLNHYNKISFINSALNYLGRNTLIIFSLHMLCIEIALCFFIFPRPDEATFIDGILTATWGIIGALIIGFPIKKYILSHIK